MAVLSAGSQQHSKAGRDRQAIAALIVPLLQTMSRSGPLLRVQMLGF